LVVGNYGLKKYFPVREDRGGEREWRVRSEGWGRVERSSRKHGRQVPHSKYKYAPATTKK
jgi:hypothetical protein